LRSKTLFFRRLKTVRRLHSHLMDGAEARVAVSRVCYAMAKTLKHGES
jgi:hypothetical protein